MNTIQMIEESFIRTRLITLEQMVQVAAILMFCSLLVGVFTVAVSAEKFFGQSWN